jgi:hypothetical protein
MLFTSARPFDVEVLGIEMIYRVVALFEILVFIGPVLHELSWRRLFTLRFPRSG